ncbi:MAG: LytTR family DNA-binding domain-containing protein [Candidatus Brevundimonas phytovorans]|nr:LytTR family DNA-binding domain-containing protein [Brevundimonas sp.]WEK57667.1 MAG: LytTR family DNA-binding domain-containing protein [Brevundimonas sp.]
MRLPEGLSGKGRDFLRGLIVAVVAGGFLAVSGAFGSGDTPLTQRLAYWIPLLVIGGLWGHVCGAFVTRFIDQDARPWAVTAALTAVITGPLTLGVWAATGLFFSGRLFPLAVLIHFLPPVALITAAVSAINVFLGRERPVETHASAPGAAPARFLDRLPPKLRGARLIAVQAEDHYLRLHTDRGSDLILMRLADALTELEGLEGAQTHRSWWVARDAVASVARGDGRAALTLTDNLTAPVSRRYARALREAGWW